MQLIDLFKVLSNPVRLRALNLLATRYPDSLCVCDFMDLLGYSQTMVSRHFKQLRDLGLVKRSMGALSTQYRYA